MQLIGGSDTERRRGRGQALTEFALIVPLLAGLVMGLFEMGVAIAANVGVNRAAQSGAHMASTAGNMLGADCLILEEIERSVLPPNDRSAILDVQIERTDLGGETVFAVTRWSREASTECALMTGDVLTVPYTLVSDGYPADQRCNVLAGCPTLSPSRSTVDNVGVAVRYRHDWITPLSAMIPLVSGDGDGWTFVQRDVFRMEPHR